MHERPRRFWARLGLALAAAAGAALGAGRLDAADCSGPNLVANGPQDANVQILPITDITSAVVDTDVVVPVAALVSGGTRAVGVPFTFTGANRAVRVTVDHPAQTFPGEPPFGIRFVGLAEIVGGRAQCDVFGGTQSVDKDTLFVSAYEQRLDTSAGRATFETKLRGGRTYQFQLVYLFEKVEPGHTETFHVRVETIGANGSGEPPVFDPALKILPKGADPVTGCPGTDLSNLTAAYRAESIARAHFATLDGVYQRATEAQVDTAKLSRVRVTDRDLEIFSDYVKLSLEHLRCARALVASRTDLDPSKKDLALTEIGRAIDRDQQALTDLETQKLADGARRDLELLARLSAASLSLGSALDIKESAAKAIDPAYVKPSLEAALDVGAAVTAAAEFAKGKEDAVGAALTDFRDQVEKLKDVVRGEGRAGLDRVLVSNTDVRCREFLELTILGELQDLAVAFEQQRREQELARQKGEAVSTAAVSATNAVLNSVRKSIKTVHSVVDEVEAAVKPVPGGSASKRDEKRFNRIVRKVDRTVNGAGALGAIALRLAQYRKLAQLP